MVPAERLVEARFGLALPALAVFARSMPGPVLLRAGDHGVLTAPDPARVAHDIAHPSWPARGTVFFAGARLATPTAQVTTPNRDQMVGSPPPIRAALRRATAVSLPAAGLRVGDYLETIAERFPPRDRAPDEGFHRIDWLRVLDPPAAAALVTDASPADAGMLVVGVVGLSGTLLLPRDRSVRVLVWVNPERAAWDRRLTIGGPLMEPMPLGRGSSPARSSDRRGRRSGGRIRRRMTRRCTRWIRIRSAGACCWRVWTGCGWWRCLSCPGRTICTAAPMWTGSGLSRPATRGSADGIGSDWGSRSTRTARRTRSSSPGSPRRTLLSASFTHRTGRQSSTWSRSTPMRCRCMRLLKLRVKTYASLSSSASGHGRWAEILSAGPTAPMVW